MVLGIHHFKKHPCISIYLYYIEPPSLIDIKVGELGIMLHPGHFFAGSLFVDTEFYWVDQH